MESLCVLGASKLHKPRYLGYLAGGQIWAASGNDTSTGALLYVDISEMLTDVTRDRVGPKAQKKGIV